LGLYALSSKLAVGQVYEYNGVPMLFSEADSVAPLSSFLTLGFLGLMAFLIATMGASVSTGAGEIMSVTTCIVNDIYKGHINKNATDRQILIYSRIGLISCAAILYILVMLLRHIGFPFSAMYQAMGIAFSSAVIPVVMALCWKKTNRDGVFAAIIVGALCGICYWIHAGFDMNWGVVWSNIIVMGISVIIVTVWSIIRPENFDFSSLQNSGINVVKEEDHAE